MTTRLQYILLGINVLCLLLLVHNFLVLRQIPPQAAIYSAIAATAEKLEAQKLAIDAMKDDITRIQGGLSDIKAMTILRHQKIEELGQKIGGK